MKIFQNKIVAVILTLSMIATSILFLAPKGLEKQRVNAETLFFNGENNSKEDSAVYNLKMLRENATQLNSLYIKYIGEDETSKRVSQITESFSDIKNMSQATKENKELVTLTTNEYERLSISPNYKIYEKEVNRLKANINGFEDILSRLKFNEEAKKFDALLENAPAKWIASFGNIEKIGSF